MISTADRAILRELARRVAELAAQPIMAERRRMWVQHNALRRVRPMILVFPEGGWREILPEAALSCQGEEARAMEVDLRRRIFYGEHLYDDTVIEATWEVGPALTVTGWGLEPRHTARTQENGSWGFDPVLNSEADLELLRYPEVRLDEAETARRHAQAEEVLGDILRVERRGVRRISFHLARLYIDLRGLSQTMWDMYDHPQMLHRAMAFFEEGYRRYIQQVVDLGLLDVNNDGTYHSSGGVSYTEELPAPGYTPGKPRLCDLWASAESQEMAQVSPALHEEFLMQYERRLLEPFGLNGYGCCEDLTHKLDRVMALPHMRRISISPWADVERCAEQMGDRFIFSWKPNPAHLVGQFDDEYVRAYIRKTLEATRGCVVEMILKDTHTCEWHPERFSRWSEIARELAEEYA